MNAKTKKNRIMSALLALAMLVGMLGAFPLAAAASGVVSTVLGDTNEDGVVTAADAAAILRHIVKLQTLTPQGLINAKVTDGTGPVSAADAAKILRWIVGVDALPEPPPICCDGACAACACMTCIRTNEGECCWVDPDEANFVFTAPHVYSGDILTTIDANTYLRYDIALTDLTPCYLSSSQLKICYDPTKLKLVGDNQTAGAISTYYESEDPVTGAVTLDDMPWTTNTNAMIVGDAAAPQGQSGWAFVSWNLTRIKDSAVITLYFEILPGVADGTVIPITLSGITLGLVNDKNEIIFPEGFTVGGRNGSITIGENPDKPLPVPEYNPGDIAVINAIIENNGLDWPKCPYTDGDLSADPTWMTTNWGANWARRAEWSADATDKRIINLGLWEGGLTGVLDVTGLTRLERLECARNSLTEVHVSGLVNLKYLFCYDNNLTELDASGLTNLERLSCYNNALTELNTTGLTELEDLNCSYNSLTALDLTGLANLNRANVSHNLFADTNALTGTDSIPAFEEWDTGGFTFSPQKVRVGDCYPGDIAIINTIIENNSRLGWPLCPYMDEDVKTDYNWMSMNWPGVWWSGDAADKRVIGLGLGWGEKGRGPLETLDVSGLTNLEWLTCSTNRLTELNVSGLAKLKWLVCYDNNLTELDLSGLTNLEWLWCYSNRLTELNVSGLAKLEELDCWDNDLTELDVTDLTNLQALYCSRNNLTALDVSGLTNLEWLYCDENNLTTLDLSGLAKLEWADVSNNYFANTAAVTGTEDIPAFEEWDAGNFTFSPQKKRGDVTETGTVTAADAAAILRYLVRLQTLTPSQLFAAKVTAGPGPVSAADAAKILRWLVRLEKEL